jgi:hypothetical protein
VVDAGGSHIICISTKGAGTYCFDTARHTWIHVGEWALPFHGKVEYVPELKLWFGMSAKDGQLAAANLWTILSTTDSQPQLVGAWKELEPPPGWMEMLKPQLASLGSGRFFHSWIRTGRAHFFTEHFFTVLTGADVVRCAHDGNGSVIDANDNGSCSATWDNGTVDLEIIRHNWRFHTSYGRDGNIRATF